MDLEDNEGRELRFIFFKFIFQTEKMLLPIIGDLALLLLY